MQITRYVAPFNCKGMLSLLENAFGLEEAALEKPQLDGSETEYNSDIVYIAHENEKVLGTIHATIPHAWPKIAGLSGMVTAPEARGTGLGRKLFGEIVKDIDSLGVETTFLGTSNPIAQKLYSSFGFSYLFGSCVMMRTVKGGFVDFDREAYGEAPKNIAVREGAPDMRIPIIPLTLQRTKQILLDCNTGLINCNLMTQCSCMGLFPKYMDLKSKGGSFFGAYSDSGVLGAVASVIPTDDGMRCDFFYADNFESAVAPLLNACRKSVGEVYFQIANGDVKANLVKEFGAVARSELFYEHKGLLIPCVKYV